MVVLVVMCLVVPYVLKGMWNIETVLDNSRSSHNLNQRCIFWLSGAFVGGNVVHFSCITRECSQSVRENLTYTAFSVIGWDCFWVKHYGIWCWSLLALEWTPIFTSPFYSHCILLWGRGDRTNWSGRVRQAISSVMRVNLVILVNVQALNSVLQTLTSTFPRYRAFTIHSYIHPDIRLNSLGIIHASWRHG